MRSWAVCSASAGSTASIFEMYRTEACYPWKKQLVAYDPHATFSVVAPDLMQPVFALPWGGTQLPVHFEPDARVRSCISVVHLAVRYLKAGGADVTMALGAEENFQRLVKTGAGITPPRGSESDRPCSNVMAIYAELFRYCIKTRGTTQRPVAVVIPCTEEGLKRIGADKNRVIKIAASVLTSFTKHGMAYPDHGGGRRAAKTVYEMAGLGPEDMDVAEVHDASAMGEIIQVGNLGFAPSRKTALGSLAPRKTPWWFISRVMNLLRLAK